MGGGRKSMIKEISGKNDLKNCLKVFRDCFRIVGDEFELNKDSYPTHPSFMVFRWLREKGVRFFGFVVGKVHVGFVAVKKANENAYYMEKLAVLPEDTYKGYGMDWWSLCLIASETMMGRKIY
jgi:hypothetical protein